MWSAIKMIFLALLQAETLFSYDNSGSEFECREGIPIKAKEGQQLSLRASKMHSLIPTTKTPKSRCFLKFLRFSVECCYGAGEQCDGQHPDNREDKSCPSINMESKHSSKCSASITSVTNDHEGLYKVFNSEGVLIQECLIVVIPDSDTKATWTNCNVFVVNCFLAGVLFFYATIRLILTQKMFVADEEYQGVIHVIKHQLHKILR